jgi:hypothetical protein
VRGGAAFYAEDLGHYAENGRSTNAQVKRIVHAQKELGLDLAGTKGEAQLGGATFARVDFQGPLFYQAAFVKACNQYAFVFFFAAANLEGTNNLIAQTNVKLDMKKSGCHAATSAPSPG